MSAHKFFQIAIDGPVASGKGTIAKNLASQLKFLYVDTGAMYRTSALLCQQKNIPILPQNETLIVQALKKARFHLQNALDENKQLFTLVTLNGRDVSDLIRTSEISLLTSKIATLPQVRQMMVQKQQNLARKFNLVMEGRDIGIRVLPQAQIKIYLTATLTERVRRRQAQLQTMGDKTDFKTIKAQIQARDQQDMQRAIDPLVVLPEAMVLDTTNINITQAVAQIVSLVRQHPDYQP